MKYLSILAFTLICSFLSITALCQLSWLNPQPSGSACIKITFSDDQHGLILNRNGDLLYTADQGLHWNFQQNFLLGAALDVHASSGTGIICTASPVVYVTFDTGNTWQSKNTGLPAGFTMAKVVSHDTIFIANPAGKIYRTDDAGDTWQAFNCGVPISSIEFINSKTGYAGASSASILKTEDGGATWVINQNVNVTPSGTGMIKFFDINTGYACRKFSSMLSTKDGGKTWANYDINDEIYAMHIIDQNTAYACGDDGVIYRTTNGGASWTYISPDGRIDAYDLNSICFVSNTIGFAVGSRGRILKTTDGGASWKTYSPTYSPVTDLSFPSTSIGYATVARIVYKTSDAGNSWVPVFSLPGGPASTDNFQKMFFFNTDTGIAVTGINQLVYKTYNGGQTWKTISGGPYLTSDVLTDLQFLDGNTGYMVHDAYNTGVIVKTKDKGETWSVIWDSKYIGPVFSKIFFLDEKIGFASRYGTLYKTTDSAKTWTLLFNDDYKNISSISFVNRKTGFITGYNGLLKMTTDSGNTWKADTIPYLYSGDVYNAKFIDENVGFVSTEYGVVYKTVNAGKTWTQFTPYKSYQESLPVIAFGPDSSVYLAGGFGAILRAGICELNKPVVTTPVIYCINEPAAALTASGNNLRWYRSAYAGPSNFIAPVPVTSIKGVTPYWVTSTSAVGCESERTEIDVIVADSSAGISTGNNSQTGTISGPTSFSKACNGLIAKITPSGVSPVSGNITANVWVENNPLGVYTSRHYEITPQNNAASATAKITLFFTQAEFDGFNAVNALKLPAGPSDLSGISRLLIEKRSGTSNDGTGLPATYNGTVVTIDPADTAVVWNAAANCWEISFDVTGFSGFFVKTALDALPLQWLNVNAGLNSQQQAVIGWKVEERNVLSYEVEKSTDAVFFSKAGTIAGKGDGIHVYQFTEPYTLKQTSYYRIRQTDKDLKITYSPILKLKMARDNDISIFPNPAETTITISTGELLQNSNITILDITGRMVLSKKLNTQTSVLDLQALKPGVYFVKFENGKVEKLIRQ